MTTESKVNFDKTITHPDGTLSYFGNMAGALNIQKLPTQPEGTINWQAKLDSLALPLRNGKPQILAWGLHSLAFTTTATNGHPVVAVLSQNPFYQSGESSRARRAEDQRISAEFSEFTLPQSFVVTEGLNPSRPALMKLAPQVAGATLHELGLLHLGYNQDLLEQWSRFTLKAIGYFLRTGDWIDTIGHLSSSYPVMILERLGLLPFASSNLMVDYTNNQLFLVDCEPYKSSNLKWKIILSAHLAGAAVGFLAAQGMISAGSLRDRLFAQPTRLEEVKVSDPENNCFLEGVADAIEILNQSDLNYRVVGSLAIAATIQSRGGDFYLTSCRGNRSRRDIDIIILGERTDEVGCLQRLFDEKRRTIPAYPEVSLHPSLQLEKLDYEDCKTPRLQICLTRIAIDKYGQTYLTFKDVRKKIPVSFFDPVYQNYDGICFPTVEVGTLVGLTLTRNGGFRTKDFNRLPFLNLEPDDIPQEFISFVKALRTTYPTIYRNTMLREFVYHLSGGYLLGGRLQALRQAIREKLGGGL